MARAAALIEFCRAAAAAGAATEIMPELADLAASQLEVTAAAVLRIGDDDRLAIVASRGLPPVLSGWRTDADTIGPELGERLIAASNGALADARLFPMVSGGDLFGVLAVLDVARVELSAEQIAFAEALVDLAAIAAARADSHAELARSYAELRASREVLARTERLRVLGQMAAGVSHDVKNLLNPIGLQLEILRRRIERGRTDEALETIAAMRDVIAHGTGIVERLRDFSRQAPERVVDDESVDLDVVARTAIELSRPRVAQHPGITLTTHLEGGGRVHGRASELTSAIVNLVVNAIEALGDRGSIVIRSGAADGGGWVEVGDDGPGMPPEVERRVFEPFFTTKEHGTGLGLAMVYAFVQRHGGRLTLDTALDRGTRIRLWFPASSPVA